ncbi:MULTISPECIES: hypothetical protein [Burkholderia]|uniref:Uncharacterized protein n=1 Tax=Burkholderia anthinoferrum TaxID=3090833 RepID=A0ABU5WPJ7_9BURK|nr:MULTISPECIES: hypothetical protein [Burkholderia]MEB2504559.1 hypothetical protein [Burkholderia anthinoferrum]MEB2530227.1 hypothetical protein [Burkholderia anthinoferrum]MEB2561600.1 hypothetical protein [Burkholderia anthinoferrum]MEB2580650.1 hypothetical protein [Burkholderia anthinoferrum]MCA8106665.1 hypothetical protein [Burkholderia sp. AU36459]
MKALWGGALVMWIFISPISGMNCLLIDELKFVGSGLIAGWDYLDFLRLIL